MTDAEMYFYERVKESEGYTIARKGRERWFEKDTQLLVWTRVNAKWVLTQGN